MTWALNLRMQMSGGEIVVFYLIKYDKYFDASLKASYNLSSAFNKVKFHNNLVIPDFSKLYADEEFKNLIKRSEAEKNSKFHGCKLQVYDDLN